MYRFSVSEYWHGHRLGFGQRFLMIGRTLFAVLIGGAILLCSAPSAVWADGVTLLPVKDNTLYEPALPAVSNGAGNNFFAGRTGTGFKRRGLLAFNVADSIPAGATITSVTLTLHLSRTNPFLGAPAVVELHKLLAAWGEEGSDPLAEEGSGAAADSGDATWEHAFFDTTLWSIPGGDFAGTVSASQTVDTLNAVDSLNFYSWTDVQMVADVQSWLDDPSSDFGWIVIGDEDTTTTTKRFDTREDTIPSFHPRLDIEFTPLPTGVSTPPVARRIALYPPLPNPFNPSTRISYTLLEPGPLTLSIYDIRGRLVRTLVDGFRTPGTHSTGWGGRNDAGVRVSSGVYFARLYKDGEAVSRRIVFLK